MTELVTNLNEKEHPFLYDIVRVARSDLASVSPRGGDDRVLAYAPLISSLLTSLSSISPHLDKYLIMAIMAKESYGNPRARNRLPARGLAQFIDATATAFKVMDPYNYADNLQGFVLFINANMVAMQKKTNSADSIKAYTVASHLAGPGNAVSSYQKGGSDLTTGIKTRAYVVEIEKFYRKFGGPGFTLPA